LIGHGSWVAANEGVFVAQGWRTAETMQTPRRGHRREDCRRDRIVSIIDPRNAASAKVAERLGERRTGVQFTPFREPCDVWDMRREDWRAA
jgi:hypothetical protein